MDLAIATIIAAGLMSVPVMYTALTSRKTHQQVQVNGGGTTLGAVARYLVHAHEYNRQRTHAVLEGQYRLALYLYLIGKKGLGIEELPEPETPKIDIFPEKNPFDY